MPILYEVWMDHCYQVTLKASSIGYIIDVGANVGLSSLYFHDYFPQAAILSVEPSPDNLPSLQLNTQQIDAITIITAAVSDQVGNTTMSTDTVGYNHKIDEGNGVEVTCITMSHLLQSYATSYPVLFVKMDIEGGELAVFESNTSWLLEIPRLIIETHGETIAKLVADACRKSGFTISGQSGSIASYERGVDS